MIVRWRSRRNTAGTDLLPLRSRIATATARLSRADGLARGTVDQLDGAASGRRALTLLDASRARRASRPLDPIESSLRRGERQIRPGERRLPRFLWAWFATIRRKTGLSWPSAEHNDPRREPSRQNLGHGLPVEEEGDLGWTAADQRQTGPYRLPLPHARAGTSSLSELQPL
jgi:hypothetical protein